VSVGGRAPVVAEVGGVDVVAEWAGYGWSHDVGDGRRVIIEPVASSGRRQDYRWRLLGPAHDTQAAGVVVASGYQTSASERRRGRIAARVRALVAGVDAARRSPSPVQAVEMHASRTRHQPRR